MHIIIDTLGSDLGVEELVEGGLLAEEEKDIDLIFLGPKDEIMSILEKNSKDLNQYEIIDTKDFISNEEDPVRALRRKKESTTVLGLNRLNEIEKGAFISAGSTGALLAGGLFITKRIDAIDRAVLGALLPSKKGGTLLVDTGANMDTKSSHLEQFALMGSIYMQYFMHIEEPKVYLLNVGLEEGKGDKRSKETYNLLAANSKINFMGNIEARDIMTGDADVIVADGFSGNIALKSMEGIAGLIFSEIKEGVYSSFKNKLAGLLLKNSFKKMASNYNYKEVGGAPLLGVKKTIYKAHGSSDRKAIKNAVLRAIEFEDNKIIEKIKEEL